jgi:hypothetical protein
MVKVNCSKIKYLSTSRARRKDRETSDRQSTNLGVRSSNLFGRANQIRNLGWFCPLVLGPFALLGYTIGYTTALACAREAAGDC